MAFFLTSADRLKTKTVGKHRCGGSNITHRSFKLAAVVNREEEPAGVIGWGFFQSISIPQKCKTLSATITETSWCWHHQVFCTDIEETGSLKRHFVYFEFTVNTIGLCKTLYIYIYIYIDFVSKKVQWLENRHAVKHAAALPKENVQENIENASSGHFISYTGVIGYY